jgi:hypothetical protein
MLHTHTHTTQEVAKPKAAPKVARKAETMGDDYTAPVVQQQAQTGYTAPAAQQQAQTDILKSTLCIKFARYLHKGTDVSKILLKVVQQQVRYTEAPVRPAAQVQWIESPAPVQPV